MGADLCDAVGHDRPPLLERRLCRAYDRGVTTRQPFGRKEYTMNVGISVPLPAYSVDVAAMARAAEALGFESLWCAEHPIMPVHTSSRFPGAADGIVPESYSHFVDP